MKLAYYSEGKMTNCYCVYTEIDWGYRQLKEGQKQQNHRSKNSRKIKSVGMATHTSLRSRYRTEKRQEGGERHLETMSWREWIKTLGHIIVWTPSLENFPQLWKLYSFPTLHFSISKPLLLYAFPLEFELVILHGLQRKLDTGITITPK
jgi:hypothetical protein